MPIYAYRCAACGLGKDVLQKMSDPPLTVCPSCGQAAMEKQVTTAGFQLKGSGWYVTDFRDGGSNTGKKTEATAPAASDAGSATNDSQPKTEAAKTETSSSKADTAPAASASVAAPAGSAAPAASAAPSAPAVAS